MVFSVYEGVGTQITENFFDWKVKENGIFLVGLGASQPPPACAHQQELTRAGVLSIIAFIGMKPFSKRLGDRWLMMLSSVIMLGSLLVLAVRSVRSVR